MVGSLLQEEGITELLQAPAKSGVPGVVGTRCLSDNLSDLKAQVAANAKGIALVRSLIAEYTLSVVQAYMAHIQTNAEEAVRQMLFNFSLRQVCGWHATGLSYRCSCSSTQVHSLWPCSRTPSPWSPRQACVCAHLQGLQEVDTVRSEDRMDDGTPIRLAVTIDRRNRSATFDFEGTGPQVFGNTNAPPAVTYSAVIYSLRCLVDQDIPLNGGCLAPVTIKVWRRKLMAA
jgi:5-oxoprolinase (ATP-hydrolysing)